MLQNFKPFFGGPSCSLKKIKAFFLVQTLLNSAGAAGFTDKIPLAKEAEKKRQK
jgi:hypothetical protein